MFPLPVFDALEETVQTLVNDNLSAGSYGRYLMHPILFRCVFLPTASGKPDRNEAHDAGCGESENESSEKKKCPQREQRKRREHREIFSMTSFLPLCSLWLSLFLLFTLSLSFHRSFMITRTSFLFGVFLLIGTVCASAEEARLCEVRISIKIKSFSRMKTICDCQFSGRHCNAPDKFSRR